MDRFESTRLEQFRQFKKEIRGSQRYLIVGLDIAKDQHHAFFGTATGHTLWKRWLFDNSQEGFQKLLLQTEALQVQHALPQVVFGLEPTANYHKPLGEYLIRRGYQVVLVSGVAVKRNRELLDGRWDKHDTKDSANVADLISQGKCLYYECPDPALRDLRSLLVFKRRLKRQEQGWRVRIRNHLLAQYFPELDRYARSSEGFAVVGWGLDPSALAGLPWEAFLGQLSSQGKVRPTERLQTIWEKAKSSIGCKAGPALQWEVQVMVEGLKRIQQTIQAAEAKIQELCCQFPEYPFLLSIPGFGPEVSSQVLGAIGDPFRFQNGKQVLKMAGLDLSADRSGKTSAAATPVISKKGKAGLRYALYQAALIASVKNRSFMAYYTGKLRGRAQEKGIQTKMRVKLAAKLLMIAWTLMKRKEAFDPERLALQI
jgi:transposase